MAKKSWICAVVVASLTTSAFAVGSAPDAFKIYIEEDGVYRVTGADLSTAGLDRAIDSQQLHLSSAGKAIPIWVHDGGDGLFDAPEDWFEFVGSRLPGDVSYLNEHTRFNVYQLRIENSETSDAAARMVTPQPLTDPAEHSANHYRTTQHLEEDEIILRLRPSGKDQGDELWYWARLDHLAKEPHRQQLDLSHLDLEREQTLSFRLGFRGWSEPRNKTSAEANDHEVTVLLNDQPIGTQGWNGTGHFVFVVDQVPPGLLTRGDNTLGVEVSSRPGRDGKQLVDVVMLNWIEIDFPRTNDLSDRQARLELPPSPDTQTWSMTTEPGKAPTVYTKEGARISPTAVDDTETLWQWSAPDGQSTFYAATSETLLSPEAVTLDHPSNLRSTTARADYLMITHTKLRSAIEPLAEFHRKNGLIVEVVDIEDVYDEFEHGVSRPHAIRSFLEFSYHHWQPPAPRFVLLVGDSSWDAKNPLTNDANYADWTFQARERNRFIKNASNEYDSDAHLNHRNLIPTWSHSTSQGHSASDNYFVAFEGDDSYLPMMAIGRIPVTEPEEVTQIVDKTIRYASTPTVGPWRRNALFITNESVGFQRQSDRVAGQLSLAGFSPSKVYPARSEADNELNTQRLIDSFDDGQLFIQFLGHGGRYIWRTGPPDFKKNHDLFTLDHLDQLAPNDKLPIVVSLTCYSAPFDHPSADSIGEKLLRVDNRGAVAVFAASWRNSPSARWGEVLFDQLTTSGATLGEAIMASKREIKNRMFVETYNLLGDPALRVALPEATIDLQAELANSTLSVAGTVDLEGDLIVDLVDANGDAVVSEQLSVTAGTFAHDFSLSDEDSVRVASIRAYAWNLEAGRDAAGAVPFVGEESTSVDTSAP